jgi:anti-sigma factor RsiW
MKLFSRDCESRQTAYLAGADRLGTRERIALEAHAATCADCADALRNSRPIDAALRGAFAPLRERRTIIAPGRVRLAVGPRSAAATNPWLRAPRFVGRLAEVSVMVGVTLFAVGSSLGPTTSSTSSLTSTHSVLQQYFRAQPPLGEVDYVRWLRLLKADASSTVSDPTRLPMGGRFDYDPVEFAKGSGVSPR